MQTTTFKNNWITTAGLLLALPTAFYLLFAFMKYEMNVEGPFDALQPTLMRWGLMENVGWNINLLLVFGPAVTVLLTFFQIVKFSIDLKGKDFFIGIVVHKRWFPLLVTAFGTGLMAILALYLFGENCLCA